ncbi:hypothetical protein BAE44_0010184 [Dichanthelium oligosanthes]|uniref:Uncharacterized protein n=1 Tax=Dichanthelium oligosanthes TaxID=888268 RepID=A0A1E5VUK1_9POAL|nr:hypothetical protein BAE44_0010184 [Dichanthelium oligosanthes]
MFLAATAPAATSRSTPPCEPAGAREGNGAMDIEGLVLEQPYFWGPDRLPSELVTESVVLTAEESDKHWALVTGGWAGNDDPWINDLRTRTWRR